MVDLHEHTPSIALTADLFTVLPVSIYDITKYHFYFQYYVIHELSSSVQLIKYTMYS